MSRVVVAMSGGVDSSVAAWLLRQAGHEVIGLFMRHGLAVDTSCATASRIESPPTAIAALPIVQTAGHKQGCCTASDALDARRVADQLEIPFYAVDFAAEFERIIDYFVDEYAVGRTPNPCVMCNNWIKFGRLCEFADGVGAEYVATGHYARLLPAATSDRPPRLCRGMDTAKDQSYVLFGVRRDVLGRILLPVGQYHKPQIRELARQAGLRVAEKKDSQEICFVPGDDYARVVQTLRPDAGRSGEIVDTAGQVLGRHDGIENFTIGQRKGLGVALGERRYIVRIEPDTRRVVIGERSDLARDELTARDTNWLVDPPTGPTRGQIKIRYNTPPASGTFEALPNDRLRVTFDEPRYGVAPGQAVVCYDGDQVLGGGWIE